MRMQSGISFLGNSGFIYGSGAVQEVGPADVRQALMAGWVEIAYPVGGGGAPAYGSVIAATFATTVNDANPAGWGPTIARIQATPASGGSTINGWTSAGFADGQSVLFINESTTDVFTFASLSSSCAVVADRFFCSTLGIGVATYGDNVLLIRDNGYWIIK